MKLHLGGATADEDMGEDADKSSDFQRYSVVRLTLKTIAGHVVKGPIDRGVNIALGVVKSDGGDFTAPPNDEGAYRREYDADKEQSGQHGLRSEDWLPSLKSLLLESSV